MRIAENSPVSKNIPTICCQYEKIIEANNPVKIAAHPPAGVLNGTKKANINIEASGAITKPIR